MIRNHPKIMQRHVDMYSSVYRKLIVKTLPRSRVPPKYTRQQISLSLSRLAKKCRPSLPRIYIKSNKLCEKVNDPRAEQASGSLSLCSRHISPNFPPSSFHRFGNSSRDFTMAYILAPCRARAAALYLSSLNCRRIFADGV